MVLTCWFRWDRNYISKGEVVALYIGVREDHHTILYFWNAGMLVNSYYKNYGYVYPCYSMVFMVTYMIDAS